MEYPQRTKTIKLSSKDFHNNEISVVIHDGVVSVAQKRILNMNFEKAIIEVSKAMEKIAVIIEENGAIIGHIKAFIKSGSASGRLSLTNRKTDIAYKGSSSESKCGIEFNMILLNIDEEMAKKYLKELFGLIKKHN